MQEINKKSAPLSAEAGEDNWQTLNIQKVYENPWIEVTHRDVINPSGGKGIYGVVHFKNWAIGIVPLDDDYNTWLVGQYRYTLNRYSWEIPEGGGKILENMSEADALIAAQRELVEETGISAQKWTKLLDLHTSNSVTDEYGVVFVAQNLTFGAAMPEETEDLKVRKLPLSEAVEMVLNGEITDAIAMVALLKTDYLVKQGKV